MQALGDILWDLQHATNNFLTDATVLSTFSQQRVVITSSCSCWVPALVLQHMYTTSFQLL